MQEPKDLELIKSNDMLVFQASMGSGDKALNAFKDWRIAVPFNDISSSAISVMPFLFSIITKYNLADSETMRMRGVGRYIWTSNMLRLKQLFGALDALTDAKIPTILLKGAALFARDLSYADKRLSSDYDILVSPCKLSKASSVLASAGFISPNLPWENYDQSLIVSVTPGYPIRKAGTYGEIDLHWRPLPNLYDETLISEIFRHSLHKKLQGREVVIPSATDHLFLAIARCEPWDESECFSRLVEASLLLKCSGDEVCWDRLKELVNFYGLHTIAYAFLSIISAETKFLIPLGFMEWLSGGKSDLDRREWSILSIPPPKRTLLQNRKLTKICIDNHRIKSNTSVPGYIETLLAQTYWYAALTSIWRMSSKRFSGQSIGQPRFLEGFSYPEASGRWTNSRVAYLAVPLTDNQRQGEPLQLNTHVHKATGSRFTVMATAGCSPVRYTLLPNEDRLILTLKCRPLPQLGGDGLILLSLPDSISPNDAGRSDDRRLLGLFLHRNWHC